MIPPRSYKARVLGNASRIPTDWALRQKVHADRLAIEAAMAEAQRLQDEDTPVIRKDAHRRIKL